MNKRHAKKKLKRENPVLYVVDKWLRRCYRALKKTERVPPVLVAFGNSLTFERIGLSKCFINSPNPIGEVWLDFSIGSYKLTNGASVTLCASDKFKANDIRIEAVPNDESSDYRHYKYSHHVKGLKYE